MRVLVNFLPLMPRGGGLHNARNLWRMIGTLEGGDEWLGVAGPQLKRELANGAEDALVEGPASLPARLRFENTALLRLAERWRADVLWTPMGAGPLLGPGPRVMGWHDSSLAYPESPVHDRLGWRDRSMEWARGRYARAAAHRSEVITVQTPIMRERLARVWGLPQERFALVPNGRSLFVESPQEETDASGKRGVVLVVAEAKPAKNLEVVPRVLRCLHESGRADARILVTLSREPDRFNGPFWSAVREAGVADSVEAVGKVSHEALGALYARASVVFLPSLFESFSATYLEAMLFGVPLVVSDMDFARGLCGPAALYADPLDPAACAAVIRQALEDEDLRAGLVARGRERLATFPTWPQRMGLYVEALERAVTSSEGSWASPGSRRA